MIPVQPPVIYNKKSVDFFRKRHNSTICFAIGILLFLLPFAEFRCGDIAIVGNTGIGIATGSNWKVSGAWRSNEYIKDIKNPGKVERELMKDGPNIFAIVALVAGVFGIAIAFSAVGWRSMAGMCAGLLGALMLIAMMIQLRIEMGSMTGKDTKSDDRSGLSMDGILRLQFTIWYYFSLVLFILAGFLNYMRDKIALREAMAVAVDFDFQRREDH